MGLRRNIAVALSGACGNAADIDSSYHNLALQGVIAIASKEMGQLPKVCKKQSCPFSSCCLREQLSSNDTKAAAKVGGHKKVRNYLN